MFVFFFNDTATTEIYTLSLHDALPILPGAEHLGEREGLGREGVRLGLPHTDTAEAQQVVVMVVRQLGRLLDRKSTRLNSSHANISYAVFCLKKNKNPTPHRCPPLPHVA